MRIGNCLCWRTILRDIDQETIRRLMQSTVYSRPFTSDIESWARELE